MGKISRPLLAGALLLAVFGGPRRSSAQTEERPPAGKVYKLVKIIQGGDFDRKAIGRIDLLAVPYPPESAHQIGDLPTKYGKSFIYKFQATYEGASPEGGRTEFHDILMVKLGCNGDILEGYQYTLEWADTPSLDLNSVSMRGVILENGLDIRRLGLINARTGEKSEEEGIIEYNS
jgi:hypothetical protein